MKISVLLLFLLAHSTVFAQKSKYIGSYTYNSIDSNTTRHLYLSLDSFTIVYADYSEIKYGVKFSTMKGTWQLKGDSATFINTDGLISKGEFTPFHSVSQGYYSDEVEVTTADSMVAIKPMPKHRMLNRLFSSPKYWICLFGNRANYVSNFIIKFDDTVK